MSATSSGQETPAGDDSQSVVKAEGPVKKRFQNGWTKELETLMADWADKAACYRWMHEETSRRFAGYDRSMTMPVIILSTITGTANFALDGFFAPDSEYKKYAQSAIGGLSILAGIITTIGTKLAYATQAEAHRVAGISWGKFNRLICIEMNLNPDERMDAFNFLKMFRIELDRLIEQSPPIPKPVITEFNRIFKHTVDIVKPEITGILQHTKVFTDTGGRLKRIAAEATIALHYRRGVIKQMVMDSLEEKTRAAAIEAARNVATQILESEKAAVREAAALAVAKSSAGKYTAPKPIAEKQKEERKAELDTILRAKAGTVMALKEKFKQPIVSFQDATPQSLNTVISISEKIQEPVQNTVQLSGPIQEPVQESVDDIRITIPDENLETGIYKDTGIGEDDMPITPKVQTTEDTSSVDRNGEQTN